MKEISLKVKQNFKELLISIIYFFRQSFKFLGVTYAGNIDPFFAISIFDVYDSLRNKKINKYVFIMFIATFLYAIIQVIFINELVIERFIINIIKIFICILVMKYVKENVHKINLIKIARFVTVIMALFTIIAFINSDNDFLWRFNDYINKYTTTRLQLFYVEPSELGFHCAIVIIILIASLLDKNDCKEKIMNIVCIAINLIVLYFAMPMGAILCLAFAIAFMLFWNLVKRFSNKKLVICIGIAILLIATLLIMYQSNNPILMRVKDTIIGKDESNSYRIGVSMDILKNSLKDYHLLGCGFGNLNTDHFREKYANLGIVEVLANSFIYYIIEAGIFAIITLILLIGYLGKKAFSGYSIIKVGLLVFLIAYQIFGGHFTSGLTWALYGIIATKSDKVQTIKEE